MRKEVAEMITASSKGKTGTREIFLWTFILLLVLLAAFYGWVLFHVRGVHQEVSFILWARAMVLNPVYEIVSPAAQAPPEDTTVLDLYKRMKSALVPSTMVTHELIVPVLQTIDAAWDRALTSDSTIARALRRIRWEWGQLVGTVEEQPRAPGEGSPGRGA